MTENKGVDRANTEQLIQEVKSVLYESDSPLNTREVHRRIDTSNLRETKTVLRKMIDRGELKTHPRFRYGLTSDIRRAMDSSAPNTDSEP